MVKLSFKIKPNVSTKKIHRAIKRKAPTTLRGAAAFVRHKIQTGIRQRKNPHNASAPGTPPHAHQGKYEVGGEIRKNPGYKKLIVFSPPEQHEGYSSILVGSVARGKDMPRLQEWGGIAKILDLQAPTKLSGFKIGDKGPVTTRHWSKKKDKVLWQEKHKDPRTGRSVVWIKLRTKSQQAHASRLYRRIVKAYPEWKYVQLPPRPYLRPGLQKALPQIKKFTANVIRGT